jgi:ABC-type nitrate/sulfonate/bicarbonate transport system ATPase subunit
MTVLDEPGLDQPTPPETDVPEVLGDEPVDRAPKLVVEGLSKVFRSRRSEVMALSGVDLHVDDGELVCLLGASGCGKSTLLSIIGGLEEATSGEVRVEGDLVVGPGADRGMVFQGYSLFPWLSVARNIEFGLEVARWPAARRKERVEELLGIMSLHEFAGALPRELSGGMRQRVAIARSLAPEPDLLLLDEPFGALDAQTKKHLQDFLLGVWRRTGATILMVTHDVEEAVYLSTRIYVMASKPGRIAEEVTVPFGDNRGALIKRDPRFLDLRDELADLLD